MKKKSKHTRFIPNDNNSSFLLSMAEYKEQTSTKNAIYAMNICNRVMLKKLCIMYRIRYKVCVVISKGIKAKLLIKPKASKKTYTYTKSVL